MSFYLKVAWRNVWRHGRRSLITSAAMGVGVALCMAMIALSDGMYRQIFDLMVVQNLGHVQIHHSDYPTRKMLHDTLPDAGQLLERVEALPEVHGLAPRVYAYGLVASEEESTGVRLTGVVAARERSVNSLVDKVLSGRFLGDEPASEVVLGVGLADTLKAEIGDEVVVITQASDGSLGNELYEVVGTVRSGSAAADKNGLWVHLADLQELVALPDQVHEVTVVAEHDEEAGALADAIRAERSDALVRAWYESEPGLLELMSMQDVGAGIMLFVVLSVAALGVLNTMLMSVFERTRELGVLRALGLGPRRLVALVLAESLVLAVLSCGIGLVLGLLLDWWLVVYGIDLSVNGEGLQTMGVTFDPVIKGLVRPSMIVFTVVLVFVVCLLASLWPAFRAARLRPVDAMRQV